jgi:excisionase family DNA binding protein
MKRKTLLMSVTDVAETLRVSAYTVRRWAAENKLRVVKLGTRTLFDARDIEKFVEQSAGRSSTQRQAATEVGQ